MPDPETAEWQLIRLDGTILASFTFPVRYRFTWWPQPGQEITGPCGSRYRTGNAPWSMEFFYPDGFPGEPWPWPPDPTGALIVIVDRWVLDRTALSWSRAARVVQLA